MTYLAEVVANKRILDKKIREIKNILQYSPTDSLAQELISLLDFRQGKLLNIAAANNMSKISIGGTEVTISTAVTIRKVIKEKINVLTKLIENQECSLDKMEFQKQRDGHYQEYILLTMGINRNDLQVKVE